MQSDKKEKLEKISKQIDLMMQRTVENGCSEAEALEATKKIEQLLTKYDLTLGEVTQRADDYDEAIIVTKKSTRSHVHFIVHYIGELTGTLGYSVGQPNIKDPRTGKKLPKIYAFFGQKKDIKIAEYLYHLLDNAIEHESIKYKFSPEYRFSDLNGKSKITSFTNGLQMRMIERFNEMIESRKRMVEQEYSECQSLVLVKKKSETKKKYEEKKGSKMSSTSTKVKARSRSAYMSGREAANNINIHDGVEGGKADKRLETP